MVHSHQVWSLPLAAPEGSPEGRAHRMETCTIRMHDGADERPVVRL